MKKRMIYVLVIAISILLVGCKTDEKKSNEVSQNTSSVQESKNEKNIIMNITSTADWLYTCESVEELNEHSACIVVGTVKNEKAKVDDSCTIYTEYEVEIDKTYKGGLQAGDIVTVSRLGGTILAKEYFEKQDDPKAEEMRKEMEKNPENTYVNFSFDGSWQPEAGKQYVWFLEQNDTDGTYEPINVYQGIYKIEGNYVENYSSDENQEETGAVRNTKNRKFFTDLEKEIKSVVK